MYKGTCVLIATSLLLCDCTLSKIMAQLPVYDADLVRMPDIQTKGEFAQQLKVMGVVDRTYEIRGVKVIEYYEMNTARFLGFAGDTTQFDIRKMPYFSRSALMRRLVRQFGPATAHDIRQGLLLEGIRQKDILTIYGWPRKRKRLDGRPLWEYDKFTLQFENGILAVITHLEEAHKHP